MTVWTPEELAKRNTDDVKTVRENAAKRGRSDVVALCDTELENRKPIRSKPRGSGSERSAGQYVSEFHFVCPKEQGVTRDADGMLWTGTWVVAEENAIEAQTYGSLVALHISKSERSYLQGEIRGWRKSPRQKEYAEGQVAKTAFGIDFQFMPNDNPVPWHGDASGEKGYRWAELPPSAL
jgi:hypothetical protein